MMFLSKLLADFGPTVENDFSSRPVVEHEDSFYKKRKPISATY